MASSSTTLLCERGVDVIELVVDGLKRVGKSYG